ncbi:MAG: DUF3820 family protein [Flavobacteriales bacterium]
MNPNHEELVSLTQIRMPFGKYKDRIIADLPVSYLEWFARNGFPKGKLGNQLQLLHVIKTNGLNHLIDGLKAVNNAG